MNKGVCLEVSQYYITNKADDWCDHDSAAIASKQKVG